MDRFCDMAEIDVMMCVLFACWRPSLLLLLHREEGCCGGSVGKEMRSNHELENFCGIVKVGRK
jgi:hypothetical protein